MKILEGKTETVAIDAVRPHHRNVRQGDVGLISESLQAHGQYRPIVAQKSTGLILAGNHTWRAASTLGWNEIEVTWQDVDDAEALRILLVDNKANDAASYDDAALAELLKELADDGGLDGTGFDGDDLDQLLEDLGRDPLPVEEVREAQLDKAEELREKYGVERGQLWQVGRHRLLCGDSTNAEDVARLMDGEKAAMVWSDPPYGYEYQSNMRTKTKKFDVLENDDILLDGYIDLLERFSSGWVLVCSSWKVITAWIDATRKLGELNNLIVWDKGGGGMGDLTHSLLTDYELILAYGRGETIKGKRIGSVWDVPKDAAGDYLHATQKPVPLCALAIETFTNKGDLIFDPFLGSAPSMAAAEQLGRTCYGMEIHPPYVAVTLERLSQMGLKPELLNQTQPAKAS